MEITSPPTILTPWTKAIDFSGSNQHLKQVSQSTLVNALRMGGKSVTVPANSDSWGLTIQSLVLGQLQ